MKITGPKFVPRVGSSLVTSLPLSATGSSSLKPVFQSPIVGDNPPETGYTSPTIGDDPDAPKVGDDPEAPKVGDDLIQTGPGTLPSLPSGQSDEIPPPQRFNGTRPIYDGDHLPPGDPEGMTLVYCSVCKQACDIVGGTLSHCHNAPMLDTFLRPYKAERARVLEFRIVVRGKRSQYVHVAYSKRDRKFQVQLKIDGKAYHGGLFEDEAMAAKVADNAVYYLTKRRLITRSLVLNFPAHYNSPPVPQEYPTSEMLAQKVLRHRDYRVAQGLPAVPPAKPRRVSELQLEEQK